jgi:peptidoglycan hydrolase-like protein with peptidoglycan-binding domain
VDAGIRHDRGPQCGRGGAFVSVRVDRGFLGSASLLCNPFSRLQMAAVAPECAPPSTSVLQLGCSSEAWVGRVIAAVSLWPDKLWFWLGTAGLVAALAAVPSKIPSVAAPDTAGDSSFVRTADALPEDRPFSGSNLLFSQANIRFCRFQQVRLEAIGPLTDRADLAVFHALANDWNARCARYGHLPADKRAVDAEVIERREALESGGRALLGAWRRKIHVGIAAPAGPYLSGARRASASDDPAADIRALPPLITLGIPGKPEAEPVSWPLLRTPSLALLHQTVAARVQRRLSDLGYVISPADGTWGAGSRIALRHFKEANGLLRDDVLDAETVTRLFSTSALSAPPGGWTRPEAAIAFETAYPPPAGARMNPLNREDAEQIQRRLAELGYYAGSDDGVWGAASRNALRGFKTVNRLANDEEWDAATEQVLSAVQALHSPERGMVQRQKPKIGGEAKFESASARAAVPLPPKRPVRSSASTRSGGRALPPVVRDAPRPPAPIPEPSVVAAREP